MDLSRLDLASAEPVALPDVLQNRDTWSPADVAVMARPLRILTYVHGLSRGGVERVALRLHLAWQAMGAESLFVVGNCNDRQMPPSADPVSGQTFSHVPVRSLAQLVRADRPDVIFAPGNTYTVVAAALKLALGSACPPIITKVSNDLERRDMSLAMRTLYHRWVWLQGRMIDHFVAPAASMLPEVLHRMAVPVDRTSVINNGAIRVDELERFAAVRHIPALRGRRYLAIGRLQPQKNFPLLLNAFAGIATPADTLTILGEGPERGALLALAARLGIADRVRLPGHVSDTLPWMAQADVMVLSSDYEGVPSVVIEALAANLRVVATRCAASLAELTEHGRFATLVPTGDADALAAAMALAPTLPPPGAAALNHVRQFTVEASARGYLTLMARLAAVNHRARVAEPAIALAPRPLKVSTP